VAETEQSLFELNSALNLLSKLCRIFAAGIASLAIYHISDSNLLTMSDDTNSVYYLLSFCNQKLIATALFKGSVQNLSPQALLSGNLIIYFRKKTMKKEEKKQESTLVSPAFQSRILRILYLLVNRVYE